MKSLIPMLREIPASLPATSPAAGHMAPQPVFPGSWHTQCAELLCLLMPYLFLYQEQPLRSFR